VDWGLATVGGHFIAESQTSRLHLDFSVPICSFIIISPSVPVFGCAMLYLTMHTQPACHYHITTAPASKRAGYHSPYLMLHYLALTFTRIIKLRRYVSVVFYRSMRNGITSRY